MAVECPVFGFDCDNQGLCPKFVTDIGATKIQEAKEAGFRTKRARSGKFVVEFCTGILDHVPNEPATVAEGLVPEIDDLANIAEAQALQFPVLGRTDHHFYVERIKE